MGLRTRLWLVVGALVLLPLIVGGVVAVVLVTGATEGRVREVLASEATAVSSRLASTCEKAALAARSLGAEATAGRAAAAARGLVAAGYADYAALLSAEGGVVATAGSRPGPPPAQLPRCSAASGAESSLATYLSEQVRIQADGVGAAGSGTPVTALVAVRVDDAFLRDLIAGLPAQTLVVLATPSGRLLASTAPGVASSRLLAAARRAYPATFVEVAGSVACVHAPTGGVPFTVIAARERPGSGPLTAAVLAAVAFMGLLTLVLGWLLSRQLTRPLAELTAAAERVARGDLDQTLPVRRADEAGRLASSFNRMTRELRRSMTALERSRDALQQSLHRLGGALGSTHDLDGLLQVILDTAAVTAGASTGAAWVADDGGSLRLVATHGLTRERAGPFTDAGGSDLLGRALAHGQVERDRTGVAVPLLRADRVVGLLQLDVPNDSRPDPGAVDDALRTLAGQAGIAVENVLLHDEAQRLSITDPLTGLWNYRYLVMSLSREIERATRFERPLAVLMLDLDHFKGVNDTHGHARGDAVLREFANRLSEQIREVDTLARYGGEEFVLVLPETSVAGAVNLAERICEAVRRRPFGEDGEVPVRVTTSVGVAAFPQHARTAVTLMQVADNALYAAKNSGRDRWHIADVIAS